MDVGYAVTYPQLVAGQREEGAMNFLPKSRWWHWILYPVAGVLVALLLAGAVVVVTN